MSMRTWRTSPAPTSTPKHSRLQERRVGAYHDRATDRITTHVCEKDFGLALQPGTTLRRPARHRRGWITPACAGKRPC